MAMGKVIGKVLATEKNPSTMEEVFVWTKPEKLFSIYLTAPKRDIIAEEEGVEADEKKLSK